MSIKNFDIGIIFDAGTGGNFIGAMLNTHKYKFDAGYYHDTINNEYNDYGSYRSGYGSYIGFEKVFTSHWDDQYISNVLNDNVNVDKTYVIRATQLSSIFLAVKRLAQTNFTKLWLQFIVREALTYAKIRQLHLTHELDTSHDMLSDELVNFVKTTMTKKYKETYCSEAGDLYAVVPIWAILCNIVGEQYNFKLLNDFVSYIFQKYIDFGITRENNVIENDNIVRALYNTKNYHNIEVVSYNDIFVNKTVCIDGLTEHNIDKYMLRNVEVVKRFLPLMSKKTRNNVLSVLRDAGFDVNQK